MKRFTRLFCELDATTRTTEKLASLKNYFREAPPEDAVWGLHFLFGKKFPRITKNPNLWKWSIEASGLPQWIVEESYHAVGDMAETISLLVHGSRDGSDLPLHQLVEQRLLSAANLSDEEKRDLLIQTWRELSQEQCFVFNKLITGNFRVGVARTLVVRAIAEMAGIEPSVMAHRLMGRWESNPIDFARLLQPEAGPLEVAHPYPFYLASPLEQPPEELGPVETWQVEWKWDGIRAQLIRRHGQSLVWSRGDEMVTDSFPELAEAASCLPHGTVLDGEILVWEDQAPLPFSQLQRRLGRKQVSGTIRSKYPVVFVAYDYLEENGSDLRELPLFERRTRLEALLQLHQSLPLKVSPLVQAGSWGELATLRGEARKRSVEGLMLKRKTAPYRVGRTRGDWWKWKIDPFTIDAVLIYAQRGSGRRASLYTDYTFGLWDQGKLVPVAKAYSGLTDAEIREVDQFIRKNTVETFGPVRVVKPDLVFELAFEAIQLSSRHKSGIAVRFPRMQRRRQDKTAAEADTLENLKALLKTQGAAEGKNSR